jgi:two-component system nitrate/nitrite response regulator NarL
VVAGDRPIVVAGLTGILEQEPSIELVGEALNATEALKSARDSRADVVVACMSIADGASGAVFARRFAGAQPHVRIVGVSLDSENSDADEVLRAGAFAVLPANTDRRNLVDTVRAAVGKPKSLRRSQPSTNVRSGALSRRELQVLTLIAEGNTNKQIAKQLEISVRTVETHRERVMRKLNAQGTAALTKWAISLGLVHPG